MGAAAFEGCHGALDGGQVIRRHFVGLGAPNQMAKGSFIVLNALLLVLVQLLAALVQGSAYLRQKVLRLIDGVHQVAAESVLRGVLLRIANRLLNFILAHLGSHDEATPRPACAADCPDRRGGACRRVHGLPDKLCHGGADRFGDSADAAGQSEVIVCFYKVGLPLAKANSETE